MMTAALPASGPPRWLFACGLLLVLAGPALHAIWTATQHLGNPWPAAILSTLGCALVIASLPRRRSRGVLVLAALAVLLTVATWWYVAVALRLPGYDGPVHAGQSLPEFVAQRPDGSPFDLSDLQESSSALIFYRHW